jgi:hypothetical protein
MLVSELEKKAEIRIRAASSVKRSPSGASFKEDRQLEIRYTMVEKNSAADKRFGPPECRHA